jgi:hypothetical protein
MRLKVHMRLAQKQQFTNSANPIIETQPIQLGKQEPPRKPPTRGETDRKKADNKELTLDTLDPPSPPRAYTARTASSPKRSNRVSPFPGPGVANKKSKRSKNDTLPPLHSRKPHSSVSVSADNPLPKPLPKMASVDNSITPPGPLFYHREDAILARRTYSEQDVRRVRAKARNSVGLEPIT